MQGPGKGASGATGPTGPTGATGATGAQGTISVVTTSFTSNAYTLALGDANTKQLASNGSTAATITVPTHASVAFAVGTMIMIEQTGTGKIQIAAAGGVTINWAGTFASGTTGCNKQYSLIALFQDSSNTWNLSGDAA